MQSHQSQSRGKSLSSQQDTRNPTTNKKVIFYTPVKKQTMSRYYTPNKIDKNQVDNDNRIQHKKSGATYNSMYQLKARKQQCMRSSRYLQAKQLSRTIDHVEKKRARTQLKHLLSQHKSQRKLIKRAHMRQMQKFEQVWQNYFIGLRAKQQMTLIHFRRVQQRDIHIVQEELVGKCRMMKLASGELKSLEKTQRKLRKQQRIDELIELKREKKLLVLIYYYHLMQKCKLLKQQQQRIYSWAKKQQEFLKTYHTKKYNALVNRIEELHNDKYRHYQKEGHRLRLKYHNVMRKLDHQQKLQLNQLLEKFPGGKELVGKKARAITVSL